MRFMSQICRDSLFVVMANYVVTGYKFVGANYIEEEVL